LQAQTPKEGEAPTFHMASYLLDVICTRNVFTSMNLSWHVTELLVHVYFIIMWDNRYKKYYALICDEFIARVYFIIFKKECPRLVGSGQENDLKSRPLVPRGNHDLYQGVWGHSTHHIYSPLTSQTGSSWEKYVTKPSCRAIMPLWLRTRSERSYPMVSIWGFTW
jgi:hypothetical protein